MNEPFPIWITRYCLSSGIEEATACEYPGVPDWCIVMSGRMNRAVLAGGHWFRTKAEAVKAANKLLERVKQQQRERLEELESVIFTDKGEEDGTDAETDR